MNISPLMRSPGANAGSLRTHRPADAGLPGGLIFLSLSVSAVKQLVLKYCAGVLGPSQSTGN